MGILSLRLKAMFAALNKQIAEQKARIEALEKGLTAIVNTADEEVTDAIGPLYGAGIHAGVLHCAKIARDTLEAAKKDVKA